MSQETSNDSRNVLVAYVGSRPLVVYVDEWPTGTRELVEYDGDPVMFDDEQVFVVLFE